jgi:glycosyltransferase involved in cell wall biosynthesis
MTTTPTVSVIIPTYNRAGMLKEAIDSVLDQDYSDFELIVVDDGSIDETPQILNCYGGKIKHICQRNQGVSAARNRGIATASGRYMAFLDSDDLWLPGKLTIQTDFLRSTPEALICQTEEIWIRNGVRVNPRERHQKYSGMIFERSLALCLVSPSAVMVRRGLFDKFGLFDESLPACEDYDMWLRVSCRCPVYLINKPFIIKRGGHADQLSRQPALDKFRIRAIKKILDSQMLSVDQYNAGVGMLKQKCALYAAGCRKRGRTEEAQYYRFLAKKYAPKK